LTNVKEVDVQEELQSAIESYDTVVVDFAAPAWCRPCQQFSPHYDVASTRSDAVFIAVDVDKAPWAMEEFGIQSVPTVKLFKSGEFVKNLEARTVITLLAEINS